MKKINDFHSAIVIDLESTGEKNLTVSRVSVSKYFIGKYMGVPRAVLYVCVNSYTILDIIIPFYKEP